MTLTLHSGFAYVVLLTLFIVVLNAGYKFIIKKEIFSTIDFRLALFALIVTHIQFLIGLINYFNSDKFALWKELGMKVMKDTQARVLLVEHPIINILAVTFITIGWSKHKKQANVFKKFKLIFIFYGLGLIFILLRIPTYWYSH